MDTKMEEFLDAYHTPDINEMIKKVTNHLNKYHGNSESRHLSALKHFLDCIITMSENGMIYGMIFEAYKQLLDEENK
jgi:hypothetical protein